MLKANGDTVGKMDKELKKRMDEFSTALTVPAPIDLRDWNGIPDHKGVTAPNIASLMFMVEENGKHLLSPGIEQDFILAELKATGFLANGHLHLDVHNSAPRLGKQSGRGFRPQGIRRPLCLLRQWPAQNPDLRVIQMVFYLRLGPPAKRALAPKAAGRKFTMWFSTEGDGKADAHMHEVKKLVRKLVKSSGGKMAAKFNTGASITLAI